VSGANVTQVLMVAGLFGMFFLGALYLQRVQGYDPIGVGLAFLPVAILIGGVSLRLADRLILRFGARNVLVAGLMFVLAGLLWFTRAPLEATYATDVLPSMLLFGIGAGMAFPSMVSLAMSGATPEDAGLASGLVNTTQQVGGALGLAVLATLSTSRTDSQLADGASTAAALVDGYQLAFFVGAGFASLAIAFALTVLESPAAIEEDVAMIEELPDVELEDAVREAA
jgi:MFS family permease